MNKILIFLSFFFASLAIQAQTDSLQKTSDPNASKYEQGMQQAFQLWQDDKPWKAANMFERIATAEPDQWLPPYYVAQINVVNSFTEKDVDKLNAQLQKAQNFINDATAISKNNPEIMVLQAQLYTAWIVFDGQKYGMLYSQKASEMYNKALKLAPENPRVVLSKAEWDIGAAKYFGQSIDSYCKDIQGAIELFATFKPEEAFYPTYSEDRAKEIQAANCQ